MVGKAFVDLFVVADPDATGCFVDDLFVDIEVVKPDAEAFELVLELEQFVDNHPPLNIFTYTHIPPQLKIVKQTINQVQKNEKARDFTNLYHVTYHTMQIIIMSKHKSLL